MYKYKLNIPRREDMKEDKSMGKGNFANMPTEVKMTPYKKNAYVTEGQLDDTITGIDEVVERSAKKTRSNLSMQK